MKILGFAGSNSIQSINKQLVKFALSYFIEEKTELLDLNDYEMEIYSADREWASSIPVLAYDFAAKIWEADLVIISFAEHNGAYSAAFKNIFDWVSRIKNQEVWEEKKLFLLSTAPGERGGRSVLSLAEDRFPRHGSIVLETFSLPSFSKSFDNEKGIVDAESLQAFESKINNLKIKLSAK